MTRRSARRRRLSIRATLTLMHAALFTACGTALIVIANWRSQRALPRLLVRASVWGEVGGTPSLSPPTPGVSSWGEQEFDIEAGHGARMDEIAAFPTPTSIINAGNVLYRQS
ncbi:MAG: hypothetical protein LBK59_05235, partial [Bifidobacteriaceae bacterium]|nr:hypothetical protein [Bifidobacteriaceae bacterium]